MAIVQQWELRAEFARRLSALYAVRRRSLTAVAERLGISGEIEIPTRVTATEGHRQ